MMATNCEVLVSADQGSLQLLLDCQKTDGCSVENGCGRALQSPVEADSEVFCCDQQMQHASVH